MKKILIPLLLLIFVLAGCGSSAAAKPDYTTKQFEAALNKGENLEGKTVSVKVSKLVPNSAFGYNIEAGKHLNFVSDDNPNVKKGDKIVVKVKKIKSALGSFIITYKKES